jgi:type I restriction enzyme S subunit
VRRASQISKQEMNAYPEYKESGIDWLGKIPSHWSVIKTNYAFDNIGSGTTPDTNNDDYYCESGINWLQTGDLNDGYINHTSKHLTDLAVIEKGLKRYPVNSLVIAMYGATIAKLGLLKIETTVNQACCVLTPSDSIENKYAFFLFQASKKALIMLASGGGQPNISQATIREFRIPVPSVDEQKAIAAYLDEKTGKIDKLIAEKTKQVEDLRSYRTSVITEAVTRGLNPSALLRQSGIDWLGEIPEHWNTKSFKYIFQTNTGITFTKSDLVKEGKAVLSYGQIHSKENNGVDINENLVKYIPMSFVSGNEDKVLIGKGDFIFADTSEDLTGCGNFIMNDNDREIYAGYHTILARNCSNELSRYMAYLFLSDAWRSQIRAKVSGIKVFSVTQTILNNTSVVVPPISEQQEIAAYLDEKTAKIDKLISELNTQLAELTEYKQAVISEAVTGKVDVRDYKSSL